MSGAPLRLALYAVLLVLVFGAAWQVGALLGEPLVGPEVHETEGHETGAHAGHGEDES